MTKISRLLSDTEAKQGQHYTIPAGITHIGDYAVSLCASLISISIPDSVTIIGNYAFFRCDRLVSINIPDSVTSIGKEVFSLCTNLKTVSLSRNTKFETSSFSKNAELVYRSTKGRDSGR